MRELAFSAQISSRASWKPLAYYYISLSVLEFRTRSRLEQPCDLIFGLADVWVCGPRPDCIPKTRGYPVFRLDTIALYPHTFFIVVKLGVFFQFSSKWSQVTKTILFFEEILYFERMNTICSWNGKVTNNELGFSDIETKSWFYHNNF